MSDSESCEINAQQMFLIAHSSRHYRLTVSASTEVSTVLCAPSNLALSPTALVDILDFLGVGHAN